MEVQVSKAELLSNLREILGEEFVSPKDLDRPSSEFMMKYFLTTLSAIGIDPMKMIEFSELECLPHPDQLRHVAQFNVAYNAIRKVYPIPKYLSGFSLLSLMEPKPSDIHYVTVFDNFYQYWSHQTQSLLVPRLMQIEENRRMLREMEEQKEGLQQWLNDRDALRSKYNMEKIKMVEDIEVLDTELNQNQAQMHQFEGELEEEERHLEELRKEKDDYCVKQERQIQQQSVKVKHKQLTESIECLQVNLEKQEAILVEKRSILHKKVSLQHSLERNFVHVEKLLQMVGDYQGLVTEAEKCKKNALKSEHNVEIILKNSEDGRIKLETIKTRRRKKMENDLAAAKEKHADFSKPKNELKKQYQLISGKEKEMATLQEQFKKRDEERKTAKFEMYAMEKAFLRSHEKICEKVKSVTEQYKSVLMNITE